MFDKFKCTLLDKYVNDKIDNIFDFTINDIKVEGYESYPKITAPLCVG